MTSALQDFYIVTFENQARASTAVQQHGGTVLAMGCTAVVDQSTSSTLTTQGVSGEKHFIWTLTPTEWHTSVETESVTTYADSGIEEALIKSGAVFISSSVPPGSFVVNTQTSSEADAMRHVADTLRTAGHFAVVVT